MTLPRSSSLHRGKLILSDRFLTAFSSNIPLSVFSAFSSNIAEGMGNCQATDAAAVLIQHADGRVERLYWPTSAGEVMRCNPGYYVALITFCFSRDVRDTAKAEASFSGDGGGGGPGSSLRLARARLLKHKDMLLIGQVYRLVTSQEVTKALQERKHERTRKAQAEQMKKQQHSQQQRPRVEEGVVKLAKHERERQRSSRQWQPSLQSISEAGS